MADQLRKDFVGDKFTPNINKLWTESTVFERAYTTCPLCVPARGSFFTGHYPNTTGCLINPWHQEERHHGRVRAGIPNLYSMMENDWDSWHIGKQHFLTEEDMEHDINTQTKWNALGRNYRSYLKEAGKRNPGGPAFKGLSPEIAKGKTTRVKSYSIPTIACYEEGLDYFFDGYITNCAVEAINNRNQNKPLLLNTMYLAPHPPLDIPEPYYSMYKEIDLAENVGEWFQGQSPLQLYNLPGFLGVKYTREDWAKIWPVYAGLVTLLDHCVGRIIDTLKDEGLYDDAIIIFTADHGEMLGSHSLWQKMCMYEESIHIPLSIKLPRGIPHVEQSNELVSHIDIMPTLCDLLDLDQTVNTTGISLRNTINYGAPLDRDHIFVQFDGNGARGNFQRCVVKGSYKLIVDIFKDEVYYELYNVLEDPQEKNNLANKKIEKVKEMEKLVQQYMQETDDLIEYPESAYNRFLCMYGNGSDE